MSDPGFQPAGSVTFIGRANLLAMVRVSNITGPEGLTATLGAAVGTTVATAIGLALALEPESDEALGVAGLPPQPTRMTASADATW